MSIFGIIFFGGLLLGMVGWLWIVGYAFSKNDSLRGLLCLLVWPVAIIYGMRKLPETKVPLILLCLGAGTLPLMLLVGVLLGAMGLLPNA